MEKYLAAILLSASFSVNANAIKGTVPIVCSDEKTFVETMLEFGETPLLTALSNRDMGEGMLVPAALVIFVNPKTNTFTIAEKIADMYCAVAMGENMKPFIDDTTPYKGT
jgi:hypothetical protein